jgi:hypothetical protein
MLRNRTKGSKRWLHNLRHRTASARKALQFQRVPIALELDGRD